MFLQCFIAFSCSLSNFFHVLSNYPMSLLSLEILWAGFSSFLSEQAEAFLLFSCFSLADIQNKFELSTQHSLFWFLQFNTFLIMKILGNVIKSQSDNRVFKAIRLPNKLECLLISDNEAEKSSTALSVGCGSLLDPVDAQGLAHYLQHMLFMGTQKYPNENEYSEFLSKNSGSSNAYTAQDETNYHFEVSSPSLLETLDRFAQFFISPLMSESSSQRELNAVHSEHSKNLLNDSWRCYQLWKSSAIPNHPFGKFSTGDKNSLSNPEIRNYLLGFYSKHYSANLMKLVVLSKQNVDTMSEIVEEKFGTIVNKQLQKYKMEQIPFNETNLGNLYKIIPIKNKQSIEYTWILPDQQPHYRNSPGKYVSHLIGHEGPGSLLSLLIREGLALELSAGSSDEHDTFSQLDISISLTDKGLENTQLITEYLLYYVQMLREKGPQEWVYKQIKSINKLKFDNLDKKQGMGYCSRLAKQMQGVPVEQVFVKDYLMQEWKPELITNYLSHIGLSNLRINLIAKKFQNQCTLIEPIYGTKYHVQKIENIVPRAADVNLPPPNVFFPDDLTLIPQSNIEIPSKIYSSKYVDLFYKPDHRFFLPKGQIKLRLYFQLQTNAKLEVIKAIYQQLLKNSLRELKYMGETAYVQTTLTVSTYFIEIDVRGFNDSLRKFLPEYLDQVLNFVPNDIMQFQDLKSKKRRQYQNFFNENPYQQAYQYHITALREGADVDPAAKVQQVQKVTFENIAEFGKQWKNKIFSEVYIGGNILDHAAIDIGKSVQNRLQKMSKPLPKHEISCIRSVVLSQNQTWLIERELTNSQQTNSSIILHFQYEKYDLITKILQDICINFVKQPAFDYLRTKEQLGYIVMCLPDDNRGTLGISILVQSNVKCSHELRKYIDNLMVILQEKINKLTEQDFSQYKKSLYSSKLQKDKSLDVQTLRFWNEITKHMYNFTRKQEELETINKVTIDEFKQFFNRVFYKQPRCFQTHICSASHKPHNDIFRTERLQNPSVKIAPSVEWFKKRMPLYPDYYAHL